MSLKAALISGSGWGSVASAIDNVIQFAVFVVLARLLSIEDVGLVALMVAIIDLGRVFVYGGLPEAMVRQPAWDDDLASVCYWFNIAMAAVFALLLAAVGGPIVDASFYAGSLGVVAALSAIFVIDAARAVHVAKIQREFRYRSFALRSVVAGVVSGAGAVALAYAGAGVWSLVFQRLSFAVAMTLTTWWVAGFRPRLVFRSDALAGILRFGMQATLVRFLDFAGQRLPDFIVGAAFGPAALGFYRVAARSLDAFMRLLVRPLQDAAFSAFSRVEGRKGVGAAFAEVAALSAVLIFPFFVGLAVVSADLIVVVFGDRFEESGLVMALLAVGGIPAALALLLTSASLGAGDGRTAVANNLFGTLAIGIGTGALVFLGLPGAALGNTLAQFALFAYGLWRLVGVLHLDPGTLARKLAAPFFVSLAMGAVLLSLRWTILFDGNPVVNTIVLVLLGIVIYPLFFLLFAARRLKEIRSELAGLLPRRIGRLLGGTGAPGGS